MSLPQTPKPAKLIISLLLNEKKLLDSVAEELTEHFGLIDMISPWFPFHYTTYYKSEMGEPLFRRMVVFKELIEQDALSKIKTITNEIELNYSKNRRRSVNIDPGYILLERFVLATGKNFTHRIYIGKNMYADLTLIYQKGGFQTLPWTYPDYADKNMRSYLELVRNKYITDL